MTLVPKVGEDLEEEKVLWFWSKLDRIRASCESCDTDPAGHAVGSAWFFRT